VDPLLNRMEASEAAQVTVTTTTKHG